MSKKNRDQIIISRHEQRVDTDTMAPDRPSKEDKEHPDYPGITESGVEHGAEITKQEILDIVGNADPNAIIFFGGASEETRTKSTTKLRGDVLAQELKNRDDVVMYTQDDIERIRDNARKSGGKVLDSVQDIIDKHKDKKIIFTYPFFLKGFSLRPEFRDKETGKRTQLSKTLDKLSGGDPDEATRLWLKSEGKLKDGEEIIECKKTPQQIALEHVHDIQRLRQFAKRFTGDRQLILELAGHGWNEDALAVYLANQGKVTEQGFKKVGGEEIKQGEIGYIESKDDKTVFHYRGKDYEISEELLK